MKGEKHEFDVQTVSFLGFIVEKGRLQADPAKVKAMVEWPKPKTRKELQRFLGFVNFYLRFIRDYCKVLISSVILLLLKCRFTGLPLLNRPLTVSSSCSPPHLFWSKQASTDPLWWRWMPPTKAWEPSCLNK